MPTLENDSLVFRFPHLEPNARLVIDFQRTLRIPDTSKTYNLPPGLGRFPLCHVEDYAKSGLAKVAQFHSSNSAPRLPEVMVQRGGVMMPMWQSEALWMNFDTEGADYWDNFPVAIKIAAGKINALTGEPWQSGLRRRPQNYVVAPDQPWLDGFAVEKGIIRQFVAMPLGQGYSAEEQITGAAEWGGIQIVAIPLKPEAWAEYRANMMEPRIRFLALECVAIEPMGLGAGGRMKQDIYRDKLPKDAWDLESAERVFLHLVNASNWLALTGEEPPTKPPTTEQYCEAGLPWFDYYGADQAALPGSASLGSVVPVAQMYETKVGQPLPGSDDVETESPVRIGPGAVPTQ
ncbi:hypothetical protein [Sandarakinorhabdus limnophila]|uniref:hypothetical protein n=1 Tax=Sandarakinorhabdus limnophila TaxID=210512 RepID=UPI0026ED0966|nr:hypothetical protein [Sandarakinorhabdus limnophila]MCM0032771.1 hypothetical protein [Sandarakinorhabdus limnophila]